MIKAFLFDYAGVLAEDGFKNGIAKIAINNNIPIKDFINKAFDVAYNQGFAVGKENDENIYAKLNSHFKVKETKEEAIKILFESFVLRDFMMDIVKKLKAKGLSVNILSDQSSLLDLLDKRDDFFKYFDKVLNSYHLGISKKEEKAFTNALNIINAKAEETIFIDDHMPNIERAKKSTNNKIHCIHYISKENFLKELNNLVSL